MPRPLPTIIGILILSSLLTSKVEAAGPEPMAIPANFNGMTNMYYSTDTNVFYHSCEEDRPDCFILIPGADPKSFTTVVNPKSSTPGIAGFARDAKHIYIGYSVVPLADPNTFSLIDSGFAKDKRHVYYGSNLLRGISPKTFRKLNVFYRTDGRKVVYMEKILRGAEADKFKAVADENSNKDGVDWGYDNSHVYHEDKLIAELDPKTLKVFSSLLAKDNYIVICNGLPVTNVDAETFTDINGFYAKDKSRGYILSSLHVGLKKPCPFFIINNANVTTLKSFTKGEYLYQNLAIDSEHIFFNGKIIPNADLNTFDPDAWYEEFEKKGFALWKYGVNSR